jgi:YidC/Oxa1 family membrane protein insertase
MQIVGELFNNIFFEPIVNLLVLIYRTLDSIHLPGALGFSIILLTVLSRLVIWPIMSKQLKSARLLNDLKPELDKLKEKHKGDKSALSAAQMALYKEHGYNPAGGCLPVLVQFPVFIALYQVIVSFFNGEHGLERINNALYSPAWHLNSAPSLDFLGLNLGMKPSQFSTAGYWILLIPVLTAALTFIQSKMMAVKPVKKYPSDSPKEKHEKDETEDTMAAVQTQMLYMMPIMIGYGAFQFPIGMAIYWNMGTIISIFQQYLTSGWGGLEDLIKKLSSR